MASSSHRDCVHKRRSIQTMHIFLGARMRQSLALGLVIAGTAATPVLAATRAHDAPPTGIPGAVAPSPSAVATSMTASVPTGTATDQPSIGTVSQTPIAAAPPSPAVTSTPASSAAGAVTPTLVLSSTPQSTPAPSSAPVVTSTSTQTTTRALYHAAFAATVSTATTAPPPVTISTVRGSFYADSSYGNGAFDIDPSTAPVFSALYPTLNFNPPNGRNGRAGELQQPNQRQ